MELQGDPRSPKAVMSIDFTQDGAIGCAPAGPSTSLGTRDEANADGPPAVRHPRHGGLRSTAAIRELKPRIPRMGADDHIKTHPSTIWKVS